MSDTSQITLTGGCFCGQVTYFSTALPDALVNCHCQTCRRLSGAPFLTLGNFPAAAITWTSGADSLRRKQYSDLADRTHCAECGSPISMQYKFQQDQISITAGSINEESIQGILPKVTAHIFVQEKAGWDHLPEDRAPRYTKFTTGFQKKVDAWKEVFSGPG